FCSFIFIELLEYFKGLNERIRIWPPLKGMIGGVALVLLALIFSTRYLGLGLETISDNLSGTGGRWYDFLMKMIFTSITLNFGGSGGIVTPIFFIGSSAGGLLADMMGLDRATFAAIGLVGLLSGAANTPIAASIMAVELFGAEIAPYAALVCIISYLITGHRSVYPSQILLRSKSSSVLIESGKVVEEIETFEIQPRSKTLFGAIIKIVATIRDFTNRSYEYLMKKYRKKYRD
ncbi:MAG: voltage-gated chloride channel, partial [Nitrospirae bacterium]